MTPTLDLQIIDTTEGLRAFEREWQEFLCQFPPATPFQTPEWLLTWWSHFGSGEPHVLVFRQHGDTVGVLPCFLHEWNGRRQSTLMGSGVSDYLDPQFSPCHVPAILDSLAGHLAGWPAWEVCDWQDLSAGSPLVTLGGATSGTPCSRLLMVPEFDRILKGLPSPVRRNLRHYHAKSSALGGLTFEVTRQADENLLRALIDLHAARWRQHGEAGMIAANGADAFLLDVSAALARRDMLRIFSLRAGDRVVAVILAFCNAATVFGYLTAFDPEFQKCEIGLGLLTQSLRYTHDEGYQWWDFLRGEESYKSDWGAQQVPRCRLRLTRGATAGARG